MKVILGPLQNTDIDPHQSGIHGPADSDSTSKKQIVKTRKGSIARGRSLSISEDDSRTPSHNTGIEELSQTVGCLLGAGVNLPTIVEDVPDRSQSPDSTDDSQLLPKRKVIFPSLLRSARRHSSNVQLEVSGQDLQLPPARPPAASPHQEKRVVWPARLETLPEAVSPSWLTDGARDVIDDVSNDGRHEQLRHLLRCHSFGIPLKISRRDYCPGRYAVPLFHCRRCLAAWKEDGQVPEQCAEPEEPTSGPEILISTRAFKYLKNVWGTHLSVRLGFANQESRREVSQIKDLFAKAHRSQRGEAYEEQASGLSDEGGGEQRQSGGKGGRRGDRSKGRKGRRKGGDGKIKVKSGTGKATGRGRSHSEQQGEAGYESDSFSSLLSGSEPELDFTNSNSDFIEASDGSGHRLARQKRRRDHKGGARILAYGHSDDDGSFSKIDNEVPTRSSQGQGQYAAGSEGGQRHHRKNRSKQKHSKRHSKNNSLAGKIEGATQNISSTHSDDGSYSNTEVALSPRSSEGHPAAAVRESGKKHHRKHRRSKQKHSKHLSEGSNLAGEDEGAAQTSSYEHSDDDDDSYSNSDGECSPGPSQGTSVAVGSKGGQRHHRKHRRSKQKHSKHHSKSKSSTGKHEGAAQTITCDGSDDDDDDDSYSNSDGECSPGPSQGISAAVGSEGGQRHHHKQRRSKQKHSQHHSKGAAQTIPCDDSDDESQGISATVGSEGGQRHRHKHRRSKQKHSKHHSKRDRCKGKVEGAALLTSHDHMEESGSYSNSEGEVSQRSPRGHAGDLDKSSKGGRRQRHKHQSRRKDSECNYKEDMVPGSVTEKRLDDNSKTKGYSTSSETSDSETFILPGKRNLGDINVKSYDDLISRLMEDYESQHQSHGVHPDPDVLNRPPAVNNGRRRASGASSVFLVGDDDRESGLDAATAYSAGKVSAAGVVVVDGERPSPNFSPEIYDQHARSSVRNSSGALSQTISGPTSRDGSESKRTNQKSSKAVIRNPLVKNKTGKPDTQRGHLKGSQGWSASATADTNALERSTGGRRSSTQQQSVSRSSVTGGQAVGQRSAALSRADGRASRAASGRTSAAPREQLLDASMVPTSVADGEAQANKGMQARPSVRARRASQGQAALDGRPSEQLIYHSKPLPDSPQNTQDSNTGEVPSDPQTAMRRRSSINTWPDNLPNFRFNRGDSHPASGMSHSCMTTDHTESADLGEDPAPSARQYIPSLPKLPVRKPESPDGPSKPVAQVKPSVNGKQTASGSSPGQAQSSASDSSSSSSTSSSSSGSDLAALDSVPGTQVIIPDFGGLSNLSFTPAFTFSFYPTGPATGQQQQQQQQVVKAGGTRKPATKKAASDKGRGDAGRRGVIRRDTAHKPNTNINRLARRMQQKVANPKPIAKYVKKPPPTSKVTHKKRTGGGRWAGQPGRKGQDRAGRSSVHGQEQQERGTRSRQSSIELVRRRKHRASQKGIQGHEKSRTLTRSVQSPSVVRVAYQSGSHVRSSMRQTTTSGSDAWRQKGQEGPAITDQPAPSGGVKIEIEPNLLSETDSVLIRVCDYV